MPHKMMDMITKFHTGFPIVSRTALQQAKMGGVVSAWLVFRINLSK